MADLNTTDLAIVLCFIESTLTSEFTCTRDLIYTDSIKINRPGYNIHMYRPNFLTVDHSCTTKCVWIKSYRSL